MERISGLLILMTLISCSTLKSDFNDLSYNDLKLPGKFEFPTSVSKEGFKKDILLLRYALDKAYGARGTIEEEIFIKADRRLKN